MATYVETSDGLFEVGPSPEHAQVWTPAWLVHLFWKGMIQVAGFDQLAPYPQVAELAAGAGRLIEPVAGFCRWVLNDFDPRLTSELRRTYPNAVVYCDDFRELHDVGPVDAAVGSPPWMEAPDGEYLPQAYVSVCESITRPGAPVGLILPESFEPETGMELIGRLRPMGERMRRWPFPNRPSLVYYRR